MKFLNLGCGNRTSDKEGVINIDWSIYLRLKNIRLIQLFIPLILRGDRLEKYKLLPRNIMLYDLSKGIPFPDNSIDVVYHSHLFEHLDKKSGYNFLTEVKRVLNEDGILRIVVPDMEYLCKTYIKHIDECASDQSEESNHDDYIAAIIEQLVRTEASGSSKQNLIRRKIENFFLGDARKRGETHKWMYDRINLKYILLDVGFKKIHIQKYNTSLIPDWNDYGLDITNEKKEYKFGSVYIEALL